MNSPTSMHSYKERSQDAVQFWLQENRPTEINLRFCAFMLLATVICLTRLGGLTHQSLWFDEGYTLSLISAQSLHEFIERFANLTTSEHLQPLYYFLMFAWSRIAGTSDVALRLPSAVASIISCLLLYDVALQIAPTRRHPFALSAVLFFSFSSYSVFYAQEARPYALVQSLSFAVIALWIRLRYRPTRSLIDSGSARWRSSPLLFSIIVAAACLASVFNAILIVALAVGDGMITKSTRIWRRIWIIPSFAGASMVMSYVLLGSRLLPSFISHDVVSIKQPLWMNVAYTLYSIFFGTSLAPSDSLLRTTSKAHIALSLWRLLLPGAVALVLAVFAAIRVFRSQNPFSRLTVTIAIAAGIYAVGLFLCFGALGHLNILPRHASPLFVLVVVLVCSVVAQLKEYGSRDPFGVKLICAAIAVIVLCNILSLYRYVTDPTLRKDDYREVVQHVPNDGLSAFLVEGQPLLLKHYGLTTISAIDVPPFSLAAYLHHRNGNASVRLIVNEYRGYLWDGQPNPVAMISSTYSCTQEQALSHMDVERCVPRSTNHRAARNVQ